MTLLFAILAAVGIGPALLYGLPVLRRAVDGMQGWRSARSDDGGRSISHGHRVQYWHPPLHGMSWLDGATFSDDD